MLKSKLSAMTSVVIASLVLTAGIIAWLQSISPVQAVRASGLIDNSLADFELGSGDCYIAQSPTTAPESYGVILSPTAGTNFTGTLLSTGWFSTTDSETVPAYVTVTNDLLVIDNDNVYAGPSATAYIYGPTRTLEFSATFDASGDIQFAGFGSHRLSDPPFVIFSSVAPSLTVRTDASSSDSFPERATVVTGSSLGSPHRYRIDWGTSEVVYYIDGSPVVTHAADVATEFAGVFMRPEFHDGDGTPANGRLLTVDWARMTDYAPSSCMFESRVISSGIAGSAFSGLSTTQITPAGTAIALEVITSTDNSTWGTWTAVNPDGTFDGGIAEYMRYRATLSTSDPLITPELLSVRVHGYGKPPTAVRVTSFSAARSDFVVRDLLVGLGGGVLILGGVSTILKRRRLTH